MHLILDFKEEAFQLREENVKSNQSLHIFFDFQKPIQQEDLIRITKLSIKQLHDLALRGYITLEAEKEIKKQLKIN